MVASPAVFQAKSYLKPPEIRTVPAAIGLR
jgi:hypothetical protein